MRRAAGTKAYRAMRRKPIPPRSGRACSTIASYAPPFYVVAPGLSGAGLPACLLALLLYCLHPGFVGRRAVHAGDGDVVQAQVHAELAPVVHVVVQYEAANDHRLRHGEEHL